VWSDLCLNDQASGESSIPIHPQPPTFTEFLSRAGRTTEEDIVLRNDPNRTVDRAGLFSRCEQF
jgi:hypothetical protein